MELAHEIVAPGHDALPVHGLWLVTVLSDHQLPVGHGRHIEGHCTPPNLPPMKCEEKKIAFKKKSDPNFYRICT